MAGNIFSRAVMSLFMDKKARQKYEALQDVKERARRGELSDTPPPPPVEDDDDDVLPETLVRQAIDAAASELERKKNLPPGREALIEQALSIHDQKRKMIDELPREQREKLAVMAMHAFGQDFKDGDGKPKKQAKRKKS